MAEQRTDVYYEPKDVYVGGVAMILAALGISLAVAFVALWQTQNAVLANERIAKKPERPMAATHPEQLPPEPRIEGVGGANASYSVTNQDLPTSAKNQRAREEAMLRDGWVDAAGKKHPPISEAMKQIIERAKR